MTTITDRIFSENWYTQTSDQEREQMQTWCKQILSENVVDVTFEKADGTVRQLKGTLNESVLPPATKEDPLSQKKIRAVNPEVQVVYDVDKKAWRSFRWDRLKRIQFDID